MKAKYFYFTTHTNLLVVYGVFIAPRDIEYVIFHWEHENMEDFRSSFIRFFFNRWLSFVIKTSFYCCRRQRISLMDCDLRLMLTSSSYWCTDALIHFFVQREVDIDLLKDPDQFKVHQNVKNGHSDFPNTFENSVCYLGSKYTFVHCSQKCSIPWSNHHAVASWIYFSDLSSRYASRMRNHFGNPFLS